MESQKPKAMTRKQKRIYGERVEAYCKYKKLKGKNQFWTPGDGDNLAFRANYLDPKAGKVWWTFSAQEIVEMDPQCADVELKIREIREIIEMAPINIKGKRRR
jgi:hypothetical protein